MFDLGTFEGQVHFFGTCFEVRESPLGTISRASKFLVYCYGMALTLLVWNQFEGKTIL